LIGLAAGRTEVANGKAGGFNVLFRERGLTNREIEIAGLLAREGLSAGEIEKRLFISKNTIKKHIVSIYRKFRVSKQAELITSLWTGAAGKEE
jgi:DNA-binding CsgD family transcriptional regulator